MTPERPTMADMSGEKRDRRSINTDQPASTPNPHDSKLQRDESEALISTEKEEETIDYDEIHEGDDAIKAVSDSKESDVIDVDSLMSWGGSDDKVSVSETESHSPKTLFGHSDVEDNEDNDNDKEDKDEDLDPDTLVDPIEAPTLDSTKVTDEEQEDTDKDAMDAGDDRDDTSDQSVKSPSPYSPTTNDVMDIDTPVPHKTSNMHKNEHKKTTEKTEKNNSIINKNTSSDDASDDARFVLIFEGGNPKPQTNKWKDLDTTTKGIMPYIASDRSILETNLKAVLAHYKIKGLKIGREEWVKIFIDLAKLGGRKNKGIKKFGIKLAASNPHEIFYPHEFNGTKLLPGIAQNAWAGAYVVYGPGWKPERTVGLDISKGINLPTVWWKKIDFNEINVEPFLPYEIFSDEPGSMHNQEKHLKFLLGISPHVKAVDPKDWVAGFKKLGKNQEARKLLIKLARTHISVFDKEFFDDEQKTKLLSNSVTNLWIAAYRLAGAPWNLKEPPEIVRVIEEPWNMKDPTKTSDNQTPQDMDEENTQTSSTDKPTYAAATKEKSGSSSKKVSIDPAAKVPGLFLSRAARTPNEKLKSKSIRKYDEVFFTVLTPPMDSDWKDGGPEITSYFNDIMEHIFDKDKKAIIHLWSGKSGSHLNKKSEPLKNRIQVKKYASSLFLRQGFPVEFRLLVSHDVHRSKLALECHETIGFSVEYDHIQEKTRTTIGFLVGSSPASANLDDMREAHEKHPTLFGLKLLAKSQSIKLASGRNMIPWEQQVKAVHIIVGESQATSARDLYNQVYGSRNVGGFPQGIHMRFVPDISDARFPVTKGTKVKAIKMLSKQKAFLANTAYISTNTIAGIHILNTTVGHTLCQVLMSIKSLDYPELGLFISIDEHMDEGAYLVTFTAHRERFDEANSLVPLLCILLEEKFGTSVWEWFTDDAKRVVTKYKWCKDAARVVLIDPEEEDDGLGFDSDDEYMKSICDIFNISDENAGNGFEFDLDFVIEDALTPKNQYGDTGSVKTFRDAVDTTRGAADEAQDEMDTTPMGPSLEQMILNDPDSARKILAKKATKPAAVSPNQGVDGR